MPLIVEDGSIVPGADSFISLADARTLAAKIGRYLPADDAMAEVALRQGAGYVMLQEPSMCGSRISAAQELCYPRQGVNLFGFPVEPNAIPQQLKTAQVIAAQEFGNGLVVRGNDDGRITSMERVEGAVTVQYFNNGAGGNTVTITAAMDALRPLLCGDTSGFSFRVNRG